MDPKEPTMKKLAWFGRVALCLLGLGPAVWVITPSPAQNSPPEAVLDTSPLTRQERAVLEYLRRDWGKQYRISSIGLAAEVIKAKLSDDSRLRLARFLDANRGAFPAVARHGTATVALTPTEKLIARAILLREVRDKSAANREDIAREMGLSARSLVRPLGVLQKLGAILPEGEGGDVRYRVAARYPRRPSYRIDFYSHQVEVNGSDKFEVA
jgi:DNA-binding transcriptional ArsR family regulator